MQILVGALMRHMSAGLVIPDFPLSFGYLVPPYWNEFIAVNFAHRCGAVVVTAMVLWTVARVLRTHREVVALRRPALGLFILLGRTDLSRCDHDLERPLVNPTTSHVAVGRRGARDQPDADPFGPTTFSARRIARTQSSRARVRA